MDKNKSLAILKAVAALFMLLVPAFADVFSEKAGIWTVFLITALLFAMRLKNTGKLYYTAVNIGGGLLLLYALLFSLRANNYEGNLIYVFALFGACMFCSLANEYFSESGNENISRRMMYLLVSGGALCALRNVLHWVFVTIPVAGKEAFSKGAGQNDLLAVFMVLTAICALKLFRGNTVRKKRILFLSAVAALFVFVMAKSLIGWLIAAFFALVFAAKKYCKKAFAPIGFALFIAFSAIVFFSFASFPWGRELCDIFSFGAKNLLGYGGGVMSARTLFETGSYKESTVGLSGVLFAQSGIAGLLLCIFIFARSVMICARKKTAESFICLFVTFLIMLLPVSSYATVLLWLAFLTFTEKEAGDAFSKNLNAKFLGKAVYALIIICTVSALLCVQAFMKQGAKESFKKGDYALSYSLCRACAAINVTDSESCRFAAMSIRLGGDIREKKEEAEELILRAIKRDCDNVENIVEKARMHSALGEYEMCAEEYKKASKKTLRNDKYNLEVVKTLYKTVKKYPKGSSETKRAYEEILLIAKETENLDYRKRINDIADKAFTYTKEALKSENID